MMAAASSSATSNQTTDDLELNNFPSVVLPEDVLDKIFKYFDNDKDNLTNFRLVCKTWNESASRAVKRSLRWKVRIDEDSVNEKLFNETMSKCKQNLFSNFHLVHGDDYYGVHYHTDATLQFRQKYCSNNIELKIKATDGCFFTKYLSESCQSLEALHLYQISDKIGICHSLDNTIFPKLKQLVLISFLNDVNVDTCLDIIKNSPSLYELVTVLLPESIRMILTKVDLKNLKSFKTIHHTAVGGIASFTVLDVDEVEILEKVCPSLTSIGLAIPSNQGCVDLIVEAISKYASQLEELELGLVGGNKSLNAKYQKRNAGYELIQGWGGDEKPAPTMSFLGILGNPGRAAPQVQVAPKSFFGVEPGNNGNGNGNGTSGGGGQKWGDILGSSKGMVLVPNLNFGHAPYEAFMPHQRMVQTKRRKLHARRNAEKLLLNNIRPLSFNDVFPVLKILNLQNWQLHNNFNVFQYMPCLTSVDLDLQVSDQFPVIYPTAAGMKNSKVTTLKFKTESSITVELIKALGCTFPNLIDLEINVLYNDVLQAIYRRMPNLKRLFIGQENNIQTQQVDDGDFVNEITDFGITGIDVGDFAMIEKLEKCKITDDSTETNGIEATKSLNVKIMRRVPYIGDLKYLQKFTLLQAQLSKYSGIYGFGDLKELTTLRVQTNPAKFGSFSCIKHLVDNCSALVKLQVHESLEDGHRRYPIFNGSVIDADEVAYAKTRLPYLQIKST